MAELIYKIAWVLHVINAVLLIGIVLLQTGKGSEVGFAFGQGAAQTMFGSSGGKTFITRFTIVVAVLFMVLSTVIALFQANKIGGYTGIMDKVPAAEQPAAQGQPAAP
ncbi:MAG TPA: preprotein translocase subunit SecG [bacterium]|nr:preprotein translocase subunit SecG [bacterium]